MAIHQFHGQILGQGTLDDLTKFRIEVWDSEHRSGDLIAYAIADRLGEFTIALDEDYLAELLGDRRPALSFRLLYRGDGIQERRSNYVLWKPATDQEDGRFELQGSSVGVESFPLSVVRGVLRAVDGSLLASTTVRAFDKGISAETQLGSDAATDAQGRFSISYRRDVSTAWLPAPNLIVRAYDGTGAVIAASDTVFRAPPTAIVDLVKADAVRGTTLFGPAEHDALGSRITSSFGSFDPTGWTSDQVNHVAQGAEAEAHQVSALVSAAAISSGAGANGASVDRTVFYGLISEGAPATQPELLLGSPSAMRTDLEVALDKNTVPVDFGGTAADLPTAMGQLRQASIAQVFPAGSSTPTPMAALLTTVLSSADAQTFLNIYLAQDDPTAEVIASANTIKALFNLHVATTAGGVHGIADTADAVGTSDASDLASAVTLLNAIGTAFEAHRMKTVSGSGTVHAAAEAEDALSAPTATDLPTAQALVEDLTASFNGHVILQTGHVHGASDAGDSVTLPDPTDSTSTIALVDAIKAAFNAHAVKTGGDVHGASDDADVEAIGDASDLTGAITLLNDLRSMYEAHRVTTAGGVHHAEDRTNAVTAPPATDATSAIALAADLKAKFNAHVALAAVAVHGASDAADAVPENLLWTLLKAQNPSTFTDAKIADIQFALQAGELSRLHLPLVKKLQARRASATIQSFRDLAAYSVSDWVSTLGETQDGSPVSYPTDVPGADDTTRTANYALFLKRSMETLHTTASIAAEAGAGTDDLSADLATFFGNNPDFEFGVQRLDEYLSATPGAFSGITDPTRLAATKQRLKHIERLHRLTPRYSEINQLVADGLHSAREIVRMGRDAFTTKYAPPNVFGGAVADEIWANAQHTSTLALAFYSNYSPSINRASAYALPDFGTPTSQSGANQANWTTLFGAPDACDCEECASIYGAPAYLVDLLQFLERQPATLNGAKTNAKEVLLNRRPDLAQIDLTCDNTLTPLPYIDLVNEILEHVVASDVTSPAPVYPDHITTDGTAEDLRALPEILPGEASAHAAAYDALKSAKVYPWTLPFDLGATEARTYLGYLGVSRGDLMLTLQNVTGSTLRPTTAEIAAERLGLSRSERLVATGGVFPEPPGTAATLNDLWGLGASESPAVLSGVQRFLQQSGWTFDELVELLDTAFGQRYGSPDLSDPSSCDLSTLQIVGVDATKGAALAVFLHRFGRLQRRLGYTIREADQALSALASPTGTVALANALKAMLNAHVVKTTGGLHGTADGADQVATSDATDLASAITLLNAVRTAYEAHRVKTAGGVHGVSDSADGVTAATATNLQTAVVLAIDLKVKLNSHVVLTSVHHGVSDTADTVTQQEPNVDDDVIVALATLERMRKRFGVPVPVAASWFADLDVRPRDRGKTPSFYEQVFQNKAVTSQVDPGLSLSSMATSDPLAYHASALVSALGITADELALLTDSSVAQAEISEPTAVLAGATVSLQNLSIAYRIATFSKAAGLPLRDFLILDKLAGHPLTSTQASAGGFVPAAVEAFVLTLDRVQRSGFSAGDLLSLFSNFPLPVAPSSPDAIDTTLSTLVSDLVAIHKKQILAVDPTGEELQGLLSNLATQFSDPTLALAPSSATVASANALKAQLNLHVVTTAGGVHGVADSADQVTTADATDVTSAILLLNDVRTAYEAHRLTTTVHATAEAEDVIVSAPASDLLTAELLAIELKVKLNAHMALVTGHVHGASDAGDAVSLADPTTDPQTIAIANAIKSSFNAHVDNTSGSWHFVADDAAHLTMADASDLSTAIAILNELRARYEVHRVTAGAHHALDATNAITAPAATDSASAMALAIDLKAKFNAHIVVTSVSVHGASDAAHAVTQADPADLVTFVGTGTLPTGYVGSVDDYFNATIATLAWDPTSLVSLKTPPDGSEAMRAARFTLAYSHLSSRILGLLHMGQSLGSQLRVDVHVMLTLLREVVRSSASGTPFLSDAFSLPAPLPEDPVGVFSYMRGDYLHLANVAAVVSRLRLSVDEVRAFEALEGAAKLFDFDTLPRDADTSTATSLFTSWQTLVDLAVLRSSMAGGGTDLAAMLLTTSQDAAFSAITTSLQWSLADLAALANPTTGMNLTLGGSGSLPQPVSTAQSLVRLRDAFAALKRLGASADEALGWVGPLDSPVASANALKAQLNLHVVKTAGVHLSADSADQVATADATDLASAITLLNAVRTAYEAHRMKVGTGATAVHGAADTTDAITAPAATDLASAVALAIDLRAKLNAHVVLTAGGVHTASDAADTVTQPDPTSSATIVQRVRSKYADTDWANVGPPLRDMLRDKQRNAMVDYLVFTRGYPNSDQLFADLLVDVQMQPIQLTSRIKQAIGSVQTFTQRALLNQESGVAIKAESALEWSWRKSYRVWEASRQIFLYPENWILPELRDDKTPFFEDLEAALRQQDVTSAAAEDAYIDYLDKLVQVSELEVMSSHHQVDKTNDLDHLPIDILHVVARTRTKPQTLFYRTRVDGSRWMPWQKLDLDVQAEQMLLAVIDRRLYLFWPQVDRKADQSSAVKSPSRPGGGQRQSQSAEKKKAQSPTYHWEITLAWSEYHNGKWSPQYVSGGDPVQVGLSPELQPRYLSLFLERRADGSSYDVHCFVNPAGWSDVADKPFLVGTFTFDPCQGELDGASSDLLVKYSTSEQKTSKNAYHPMRKLTFSVDNKTVPCPPRLMANIPRRMTMRDQDAVFPAVVVGADLTLVVEENSLPHARKILGTLPTSARVHDPRTVELASGPHFPVYQSAEYTGHFFLKDYGRTYFAESVLLNSKKIKVKPIQASPAFEPFLEPGETRLSSDMVTWSQASSTSKTFVKTLYTDGFSFSPFYHPFACDFLAEVRRSGVDGLLRWPLDPKNKSLQLLTKDGSKSNAFQAAYAPTKAVAKPYPATDVDFSFGGAYSLYNWEVFFHIPYLVAVRLMENQRFEEAQKWFHYVFDPTSGSSDTNAPQQFWKFKPFRDNTDLATIQQEIYELSQNPTATLGPSTSRAKNLLKLEDTPDRSDLEAQVNAWEKDPFNPHLIARMRPLAYQKAVVMNYIQNLIGWGDQLFQQDTIETINEATELYILASQVLGPRPTLITTATPPTPQNYAQLETLDMGALSDPVIEAESLVFAPLNPVLQATGYAAQQPPPDVNNLAFCVPANDMLFGLWDTVTDRLFKIRNSMNIEGVVRQLPLFEPPIDPALLVAARAAGVDLNSVLDEVNPTLPNYRFSIMHAKAMELCGAVSGLGGALLSALEKKDGEGLSRLRQTQEIEMLAAVREIKQQQIKEAEATLAGLQQSLKMANIRHDFYANVAKISDGEAMALATSTALVALDGVVAGLSTAAASSKGVPDFETGAAGAWGTPFATSIEGGGQAGSILDSTSNAVSAFASVLRDTTSAESTLAGYMRRWDDWKLQEKVTAAEMQQIQQQIAAAQIRVAVAQKDLDNHDLQITHAKAVDDYLKSKFTNEELYDWMVGQLATVYFQSYKLAYDLAKRAEKTYRFERAVETSSYIRFGYWDSLRKGLLAGERLQHDLRQLEVAYLAQNAREYEITKHVSLGYLDPNALVTLRETGSCTFTLGEECFDLDYPGHYMRRIKSVSITIPTVGGPYASVNATLRLNNSSVRIKPDAGSPYGRKASDGRFSDRYAPVCAAIATSSAQSDSGLFEPNLRDERYLPFEGAGVFGATSSGAQWSLSLPRATNNFDIATVSDVLLHIRYTARDGGDDLRAAATEAVVQSATIPRRRVISARTEFPDAWEQFVSPGAGDTAQNLVLPIDASLLPYVFGNGAITPTAASVYVHWNRYPPYSELSGATLLVGINVAPSTGPTLSFPGQAITATSDESNTGVWRAGRNGQTVPGLGTWTMSVDRASLPSDLASDPSASLKTLDDSLQDVWIVIEYTQPLPSWA